jgi:hypothetical protein
MRHKFTINYKVSVMKSGASECSFLCSDCAKTHLHKCLISKKFPGLYPKLPLKRGGKGRGKVRKEEENDGKGTGICNFKHFPGVVPPDSHYKGREGRKGKGGAGNLGLNSGGWEGTGRGTRMKELLGGRERIKMEGP